MIRTCATAFAFIVFSHACIPPPALHAGVVNPNVSALGQVLVHRTDDPLSEDSRRTAFHLGESELVLDAYLNPYAKGLFVFSAGHEGFETEEAYMTIFKGLPGRLAVKTGRYRIGFGRLNPAHKHTYPFIETPRVLTAMLPGEESFADVGAQASILLPTPGTWASIASFDFLGGRPFHPDEETSSGAWVGRWSNSLLIRGVAPAEIGLSAARGTNDVRLGTKTGVYGADAKVEIPFSAENRAIVQGELFYNDRSAADSTGAVRAVRRWGLYVFADVMFGRRYEGGVLYERFQPRETEAASDWAIEPFIGYTLMEETTLFRLAYEWFEPRGGPTVHTVTFQVVFSMGPHKAHQF